MDCTRISKGSAGGSAGRCVLAAAVLAGATVFAACSSSNSSDMSAIPMNHGNNAVAANSAQSDNMALPAPPAASEYRAQAYGSVEPDQPRPVSPYASTGWGDNKAPSPNAPAGQRPEGVVMQPAKTDTAKVASTNWTQWVADWPADQRNAIQDIQLKYGPPDLVSPKLVLWMNKGDFREIVVSKDSVDHNFPMPHKDFVLVTINQKIPLDKVQDLASFSGSLICDRTGGTLAVRCNSLGMDIAALNAAREIIDGKRTADDARQSLAQIAQAYQKGEKPDATQKLSFDVAKGNTGDPGEAQTGTASERP